MIFIEMVDFYGFPYSGGIDDLQVVGWYSLWIFHEWWLVERTMCVSLGNVFFSIYAENGDVHADMPTWWLTKKSATEIYHIKGSTTTRTPFGNFWNTQSEALECRKRQCGYAHFAFGVSYEQWLLDPFGWVLAFYFYPIYWGLPSGYVKIAIENGHWNSGFSH